MAIEGMQIWWWVTVCAGVTSALTVGPRSPSSRDGNWGSWSGRRSHGGERGSSSCDGMISGSTILQELRTITELVLRSHATVPSPPPLPPPVVHDCSTLRHAGIKGSGLYQIFPFTFTVYCDMITQGGGWTVIQRRQPQENSMDFARGWSEYREGFGDQSEMWLGLEALHQLTHSGYHRYQLRVDMIDYQLGPRYALYQVFSVGSERDGYRLLLSNYSGNAGDALSRFHSGQRFSTFDRDQDLSRNRSCAEEKEGGWWFHACYAAHPNGRHPARPPRRNGSTNEMRWWSSRERVLLLTHIEMKIRRHPQDGAESYPNIEGELESDSENQNNGQGTERDPTDEGDGEFGIETNRNADRDEAESGKEDKYGDEIETEDAYANENDDGWGSLEDYGSDNETGVMIVFDYGEEVEAGSEDSNKDNEDGDW